MSRIQKLAVDIAARQHAVHKLDQKPRPNAADIATRNRLRKELEALRRELGAEQIRSWIAPHDGADAPQEG